MNCALGRLVEGDLQADSKKRRGGAGAKFEVMMVAGSVKSRGWVGIQRDMASSSASVVDQHADTGCGDEGALRLGYQGTGEQEFSIRSEEGRCLTEQAMGSFLRASLTLTT